MLIQSTVLLVVRSVATSKNAGTLNADKQINKTKHTTDPEDADGDA